MNKFYQKRATAGSNKKPPFGGPVSLQNPHSHVNLLSPNWTKRNSEDIKQGAAMQIKVTAKVTQVSFDREYAGDVILSIPDRRLERTFNFKLTDPAGDRTRYEIVHGKSPFIIVQAGGSDEDVRRQLENLPRGRQLMLPLFFGPIADGYGIARSNHVDPQSRAAHDNIETVMRNYGGSVSYMGEVNRTFEPTKEDECEILIRELQSLG